MILEYTEEDKRRGEGPWPNGTTQSSALWPRPGFLSFVTESQLKVTPFTCDA